MNCKFCGKEMPDGGKFCPFCGMDNGQEEVPETAEEMTAEQLPEQQEQMPIAAEPSVKKWKRIAAVSGCIAAMAALALALFVGFGGNIKALFDREIFRDNDIYKKESYSVSDKKAQQKHDTVVATIGDEELTNGQFQVFYWESIYGFLSSENGAYAIYYYGMDVSKPLDEQTCTMYDKTLTWQQYFIRQALHTWQSYQALYDAAMEAGYSVPEDVQKTLDTFDADMAAAATEAGYASVEEMMEKEFGKGTTVQDYRYYLERTLIGGYFFNNEVNKQEVSTEELEAYFKENEEMLDKYYITKDSGLLVDYLQILVKAETTKDEEGKALITEEAWETCRQEAQKLLDQWQAGDKTMASFSALAKEKSQDTTSASNGSLVQYVAQGSLTTIDVRHILIKSEGSENADGSITYNDVEAAATAKAKAEEILAKWKENPTEDYFGQLANEYSEDKSGNVTDGGIYKNVSQREMVTAFNNWCFDEGRKAGDCEIVETQFGYHIMYFVDRDDSMEQWVFADDRKAADTTLLKTDDGYLVVYYVTGEEGWILYSRSGVLNEKAYGLLEQYTESVEAKVSYGKIALATVDLSASE